MKMLIRLQRIMMMLQAAKIAVQKAQKMGATQADAITTQKNEITINATNNKLTGLKQRTGNNESSIGLGLRVIIDKRMAYSYTTIINEQSIEIADKTAIKLAKNREPDKNFKNLPKPKKTPKVEGIYDKEITSPPIEETFEETRRILEETLETNKYFNTIISGNGFIWGETAIANSLGIERKYKESEAYTYIYIIGQKEGITLTGYEDEEKRCLKEISLNRCKEKAIEYAKISEKISKTDSGKK